ncbi:MAG: enolase C-terminal domain-like protein [bacterium]
MIVKQEVFMVGIELPAPFSLAFGTLQVLPRVFVKLTARGRQGKFDAIGEASIDFPFSHYDAWDIFATLKDIDLAGACVSDREKLLLDLEQQGLMEFPAAYAAMNMALDDAFGKFFEVNTVEIYGGSVRKQGRVLESLPFFPSKKLLLKRIDDVVAVGRLPKIKAGVNPSDDASYLLAVGRLSQQKGFNFAVDFNAAYSAENFTLLADQLADFQQCFQNALFLEQPTEYGLGVAGLKQAKIILQQRDLMVPIMADEVFVSAQDGIECNSQKILLNYKIQKLGGILKAIEIENILENSIMPSMVGGTFPTAIGRVWDQQALCVLKSSSLPSDGWQPASDWFAGDKHFIHEAFKIAGGFSYALSGHGLGCSVVWDRLEKYIIPDPHFEYAAIRHNLPGNILKARLNPNTSYPALYTRLSGRAPDWNL